MDKKKVKIIKCERCYGVGHYSGKYGMTACEDCGSKGYILKEIRKYNKKI